MKNITEVTRQDILDIIRDGFVVVYDQPYFNEDSGNYETGFTAFMPFQGRLSELDFLSRVYDLENMPSHDSRYRNAYDDISCHLSWGDYEDFWFLGDRRFKLSRNDEDEPLLRFMCEMLHPAVRVENCPWKAYLQKFNELLRPDGYELCATKNISGRDVYEAKSLEHIEIARPQEKVYSNLKFIGEGSYAKVFKFKDAFYNKTFALKRAKKDLDEKELARFKREFEQMAMLHSPYIVEVFSYDDVSNEYVMEYMDQTLEKYISENNSTLTAPQRKNMIGQLIKGYQYLHSKSIFHRDVSFKNVLMKRYDDTIVVKISDFGLVKIQDSDLTSENSELKGCLNDPTLRVKGFGAYDLLDEIYALTLLIVYVITGKTNFSSIKNPHVCKFMNRGTDANRETRYQTLTELHQGAIECLNAL